MLNIKLAIHSPKRKIISLPVNNQIRSYTCTNKTGCPLQEKFLCENTQYEADIS